MSFTQKYAIISPIDEVREGQSFRSTAWPLHVTIADTFAISCIDDYLLNEFHAIPKRPAIKVVADSETYFGENEDVRVMLLKNSEALLQFHREIIQKLESLGAIFNNPEYNKDGFKAHITQQIGNTIAPGTRLELEYLAIIDMFPNKDPYQRKVMKIINIGKR